MNTFDKIFFGFTFWAVLPIALFLVGWWGTVGRMEESRVMLFALGGLLIGIVSSFIFIKRLVTNLYELQGSTLGLIYIFYSMCVFGFFMGVPVFNLFLGIPAGYYTARRCKAMRKDHDFAERAFKNAAIFTTIITLLFSVVSASIALSDPFTAKNLKGMFNLNFDITKSILLSIITVGGAILMVLQYYITKFSARIFFDLSKKYS